jgi:hypothetical protein
MTPDKMSIYEESESYPKTFAIALHSGETLASFHASKIAQWILMVIIRKDFRVLGAGGIMFKRINSMNEQTVTITIEDADRQMLTLHH